MTTLINCLKVLGAVGLALVLISAFSSAIEIANLDASRYLLDAGYSNVQILGAAVFGCSEDDLFRIRFSATGPTGRAVRGLVCSAPFKGATIRLD